MNQVRKINIELPEDLKIIYANLVRVTHTPGEFIMDFSAILPGDMKPKIASRVVMTPLGLKLLHRALGGNLTRYEANFGEIKIPDSHTLADDLFNNPPSPPTPPKPEA
ncbi:MAG: DUF3467 domain-containing protein [Anaerolineaceae bacterium]|nr:DUF3467 domain-containing protein [Anaerolineaceae bacterium]